MAGGDAPVAVEALVKRYGATTAVDGLSFTVPAGRVTGFLGPNGAGKTTTLRVVLGLVRPTSGRALVHGRPFAELDNPARVVGAALEPNAFHPGRSGRAHLQSLAAAARLPRSRVDEVLELVELTPARDRRVGAYSLGMRQRLALAGALLGDPGVLVLDEPANGLDPQGMRWLRDTMRAQAAQGRAVLVSSHLLAEVAQTVDELVVIRAGKLVTHAPLAALMAARHGGVRVRSPRMAELRALLRARDGVEAQDAGDGLVIVRGLQPEDVGLVAAEHGVPLSELTREQASLEEAFLELTGEGGHVR